MFTLFSQNWRKAETKIAETITGFAGSMFFVYLHVIAFILFFIFRPVQIELFNVTLSLEAIFLATFIMVSQNRQEELLEERAREEEQEEEETREGLEDIQEDFDSLRVDLDEMKNLISRLETHYAQRSNVPLKIPKV